MGSPVNHRPSEVRIGYLFEWGGIKFGVWAIQDGKLKRVALTAWKNPPVPVLVPMQPIAVVQEEMTDPRVQQITDQANITSSTHLR